MTFTKTTENNCSAEVSGHSKEKQKIVSTLFLWCYYIVVPYSTMPNAHHVVAFPHNYGNEKIIIQVQVYVVPLQLLRYLFSKLSFQMQQLLPGLRV